MLHRLSFMTLLWLFPSVPDASGPERLSSIDIVTDEDRRILQRTIAEDSLYHRDQTGPVPSLRLGR